MTVDRILFVLALIFVAYLGFTWGRGECLSGRASRWADVGDCR